MRRLVTLVLLAALALSLAGCAERTVSAAPAGESGRPANTVTADGIGKRQTAPDRARMDFSVSARAGDSKAALDRASSKSSALTAALRKAGVGKADLQTTDVNVYPERTQGGRIVGYNATLGVQAQIRDIAGLGKVIEAASRAGSTDFGGPFFYLSDENPANDEAIKAAVADARRRAEIMAAAAGKRVGAVVAIGETEAVAQPFDFASGARVAAKLDAVPIESGRLDAMARVSVTFALE